MVHSDLEDNQQVAVGGVSVTAVFRLSFFFDSGESLASFSTCFVREDIMHEILQQNIPERISQKFSAEENISEEIFRTPITKANQPERQWT